MLPSRLVEAFDKAEKSREFRPPLFVDARLRRQGRAKGFVGNAFRDLVGPSRYRWIQDLGNLAIATGSGGVQIKNPAAVAELLDLALRAADERRRVLFYCACEFPRLDGKLACHRLRSRTCCWRMQQKIGQAISVVEWPGGEPVETRLKVDQKLFSAVMRGRMSIPFDSSRLNDFAVCPGVHWLPSTARAVRRRDTLRSDRPNLQCRKAETAYWYLPVVEPPGPGVSKESLLRHAARWRTAAWTRRAKIGVSSSKHGE